MFLYVFSFLFRTCHFLFVMYTLIKFLNGFHSYSPLPPIFSDAFCILIKILLKFVPKGAWIKAWRGIDDKPLSVYGPVWLATRTTTGEIETATKWYSRAMYKLKLLYRLKEDDIMAKNQGYLFVAALVRCCIFTWYKLIFRLQFLDHSTMCRLRHLMWYLPKCVTTC